MRALAEAFKQRDMQDHLKLRRAFYRGHHAREREALLARKTPVWTEDTVIDWLCLLRIPPFEHHYPAIDSAAPCPSCHARADPMAHNIITVAA